MSHTPILLYLHGVGEGDPGQEWRDALEKALARLGYPDLSGVEVVIPKYPNSLHGVDDEVPLPDETVKVPRRDDAKINRRDFERRRTAMESLLGRDDRGEGLPAGDHLAPIAAGMKSFIQADNYLKDPNIRASVLCRVLRGLPQTGRLVIVGHSLGSIIAADLVRRLPTDLEVAGIVTIGSPLAQETFHTPGLRKSLSEPPANLEWWVNFWSTADAVPIRRGASTVFPWILDQRIQQRVGLHPVRAHSARTYLKNATVATAIGRGLFGSLSKEVVLAEKGLDIPLDDLETRALVALRYAHLTVKELEGERRDRYVDALRQVQATTFNQLKARNASESRGMPTAIAKLAVDLSDPASRAPEPELPTHLSIEDAVLPLVALAVGNVLQPVEIEVSEEKQQSAMEQLTLDMELGARFGANVCEAVELAQNVLKGPKNRVKWAALGLGATAIVAATGGLALAAAPGVAGAAAVTSALAAFGPGGMVGGLLTAGTFAGAGGGGIAIGLAAPGTTADAMEAVVAIQLATAILRDKQDLSQDQQTWSDLVETEDKVRRELARLKVLSDKNARNVKELQRKLDAVERALSYLRSCDLDPRQFEFAAE